jgi:sec-independent protein translocase protein TatA
MGGLKPWHIILIVVVLVLLFGAKRLPDAARSLGRSLRIIKAETQGLINENNDMAEKADAQHGHQPLNGEVQQQGYQQQPYPPQQPPYQQPQYQQQPPQYQQPPAQPYQQQQPPAQPYQPPQPYQQPAQQYSDPNPVQRTNDR